MSNEELAMRIKAGERDLLAQLWGQNKRNIYFLAIKYRNIIELHSFVEMNDFMQCGYFALVAAVDAYNPAKGFKLSSYLNFTYKKEIYAMFGNVRNGDARIFPLPATSLNVTIEHDGNTTELLDLLEDEASGDITDSLEQVELKQVVAEAISKLPQKQQYVIQQHYFNNKLFTEIADGIKIKDQFQALRIEDAALCTLRRDKVLRALYYAHFDQPPEQHIETANPEAAV
jgi:RNA polymerase sigma factor (sigma-70 family)